MLRFVKWLLIPTALTMVSCGGGTGGKTQAVVLIVIDTLRADHLGSYGYAPASTPHLDALAARGVRFSRAMTPVPVTLPAIASLFTGRYPYHHGVRDNERYVMSPDEHTLAERFKKAGWRTGSVVASAIIASDRGLDQGFDAYDDDFSGP
jgi:arylsulfatase